MATVSEVNARTEKAIAPETMLLPMQQALVILINEQMTFPPQPDRMRSGHLNTWVREVGQLPTSAFVGAKGMRKKPKRSPGDVIRPSEMMLEKWRNAPITITRPGDIGLMGQAVNAASYSGYVQGDEQVGFHAQTGWLKTIGAFNKHANTIVRNFVQQIVKNIQGG